jgi:hypothetical protein
MRDPKLRQRSFERFRDALLKEVLPQVEKSYRVSKKRTDRAIAGLSMGGAESLFVGLQAFDAETPQIEMPDARGAAHSRLNLKYFRASRYTSCLVRYTPGSASIWATDEIWLRVPETIKLILGAGDPLIGRLLVYDAMRTERSYQQSFPTDRILAVLRDAQGHKFDQHLVRRFVQLLGIYPPGNLVRLDTGVVAVVLRAYPVDPYRPRVRVIIDTDGRLLESPWDLNLWEPAAGLDRPRRSRLRWIQPSSASIHLIICSWWRAVCGWRLAGALPALLAYRYSLNGTWQIEESIGAEEMPREFGHMIAVPGLVHLAKPPAELLGDVRPALVVEKDIVGVRRFLDRVGHLPLPPLFLLDHLPVLLGNDLGHLENDRLSLFLGQRGRDEKSCFIQSHRNLLMV